MTAKAGGIRMQMEPIRRMHGKKLMENGITLMQADICRPVGTKKEVHTTT